MKIAIILTTNNAETNWNALRLANFALDKGDEVGVFLLGEGVEYEQGDSEKFNIKHQAEILLTSVNAKIMACGTCMKSRNQHESETCPINGLAELYELISISEKILTF